MKIKILAVLMIIGCTLSGTAVVAQDVPITAPTASAQPGAAAMDDDFAGHRRECRRRARQTDDPQERRRIIRQCRQELLGEATTLPAPMPATPAPGPVEPAGAVPVNTAAFGGGQPRALPVQAGGWENAGATDDEWRDAPDDTGDFAGQPDDLDDFAWRGGGGGSPPPAAAWRNGNAGSLNRGQRIQRLEQRLDVMEDLLRQILANQQQLLNR